MTRVLWRVSYDALNNSSVLALCFIFKRIWVSSQNVKKYIEGGVGGGGGGWSKNELFLKVFLATIVFDQIFVLILKIILIFHQILYLGWYFLAKVTPGNDHF